MILSVTASDQIQLVTSGTQTIHVHTDWLDYNGTPTTAPGRLNTIVSTAATTPIVPPPSSSSIQRNTKTIFITNTSTTTAENVIVQHTDGTNVVDLTPDPVSLQPGNSLVWVEGAAWVTTNTLGQILQNVAQGTAAALAGAWPFKITDGTNGPASVKPPSTSATTTDAALVVALSPNTRPQPASDLQGSGSISAVGPILTIETEGATTLLFDVTGTWAGTILLQISIDGGVTFPGTLAAYVGGSFFTTITANGFYYAPVAGTTHVRFYMSAYTSGTATVTANVAVGLEYAKAIALVSDAINGVAGIAPANTAPTAAQPSLVVAMSPNYPGGAVPVALFPSGAQDVLGNAVNVSRVTQITTKFYQQSPSSFLNVTTTGGATATQGTGTNIGAAVFSTGTAATAEVTAVTFATIVYSSQYESWACQSAKFTAPTSATSYQRIGIYNSTDGFSFGYNGLTFGLWTRFNATDTFVAQTAWNKDTLSGAQGSLFTSGGVPVALVQTFFNMFRIRFGWYGGLSVFFEVYAPDGIWVLVHLGRFANSQTTLNLSNPDLPLTIDISKTASDGTNLVVASGAWSAGVTAPPTGPVVTGTQTISSNGQYTIIPVLTQSSLSFSISGTWVGTIAFNYSLDGVTFTPDVVLDNSLGTFVESTTINNAYTANVGSYKYYQIVATAWTSGTATITYNGSAAPNLLTSLSLVTDASNHGPAAVTPASTPASTTNPALVVAQSPNARATYFIALQGFTTGATNADVFDLVGSASKTVRVTRVRFSMTVTTAVTIPVQLILRSTANAGGTIGVAVNGAMDSNDPAATATNLAYTTNATTLGTPVGTAVRSDKYFAQVATPTSEAQVIEWTFDAPFAKQPTLRGVAQSLCVFLGGVTIAGGNVSISFEWTEDTN